MSADSSAPSFPRTAEEWADYYRRRSTNPWRCQSTEGRTRFRETLRLIHRHHPPEKAVSLVEFGCYRGEFTALLAASYPHCTIYACDITEVIIAEARRATADCPNVVLTVADMFNYDLSSLPRSSGANAILLLECLYYLKPDELPRLARRLRAQAPRDLLFVSVPIVGPPFFTEDSLFSHFLPAGYRCRDLVVVNSRWTRAKFPWSLPWRVGQRLAQLLPPARLVGEGGRRVFCGLARRNRWLRTHFGNHVVYVFEPVP